MAQGKPLVLGSGRRDRGRAPILWAWRKLLAGEESGALGPVAMPAALARSGRLQRASARAALTCALRLIIISAAPPHPFCDQRQPCLVINPNRVLRPAPDSMSLVLRIPKACIGAIRWTG